MELNQFRDVDIVLDKANDNIIQKQFVSAGDKDGRSLTVQLTDNGVIGKIIGAAMNLYWHNQASGLTDLSAFYVVDRATSVFKIDYPQNMLTPGKVIAYIQILHGGKVTHTKPFEITVQKLAGTTRGVLATAEYGALVTTLAKANEFETDIAEVSAQLAQKANRTDLEFVDQKVTNTAGLVHEKDQLTNERIDSLVVNSGDANAEVSESKRDFLGTVHETLRLRLQSDINYSHGMNELSVVINRNPSGRVVSVEEKDGENQKTITYINRNADGLVTSTTKAVHGQSTTSTMNRDMNGKITSITKVVV